MAEKSALTREQREKLWEQLVAEHGKAQEAYDSSLRALAGAGLGVTVSLGVALKELPATGIWAAGVFLFALFVNLASYVFVQVDMGKRMAALSEDPYEYEGAKPGRWTTWTWGANVLGGLGLLAGGVLLIRFIAEST
jgi:hypothetical protein